MNGEGAKPASRFALFVDEPQVSMLCYNATTRRQVSFEFDYDGTGVAVVRIDEKNKLTETKIELHDLQPFVDAHAWLNEGEAMKQDHKNLGFALVTLAWVCIAVVSLAVPIVVIWAIVRFTVRYTGGAS